LPEYIFLTSWSAAVVMLYFEPILKDVSEGPDEGMKRYWEGDRECGLMLHAWCWRNATVGH